MIPIVGITAVTMGALTIASRTYSAALDLNFGRGQRHVTELEGLKKEDLEYYKADFPNEKSGLGDASDPITKAENDSRNAAATHALHAAEEGVTLLKNDGTLPLARKSGVTPFGYRFVDPLWSGSGSAVTNMEFDYVITPEEGVGARFTLNKTVLDKLKAEKAATDQPNVKKMSGATEEGTSIGDIAFNGSGTTDSTIYEFDPSIYTGLEDSCADTTALVMVGRRGLEGTDLWPFAYDDGTKHELALTAAEKSAIEFAKAHCKKVILVINSSNVMEISEYANDPKINGIIWLGNPGAMGCEALGEILVGEVNPSGRTVDTWLIDNTKDPSFKNVIAGQYSNYNKDGGAGNVMTQNYYEYEEGIYVDYRYYETAFAEAQAGNYAGFNYSEQVLYPFGFGLHYDDAQVTQELTKVQLTSDNLIVEGKVKNDSSRRVKDTVQIYLESPYNKDGSKIEKASKSLIDFAKVAVEPKTTESFRLVISRDEITSYDHLGYYSEGGSYVLEKGEYKVHLGKNAHEDHGVKTFSVEKTIAYTDEATKNGAVAGGKRSSDGIVAKNTFDEIGKYTKDASLMSNMSRSNFAGTFPTAPTTKVAPDYVVAANGGFDENNAVYGGNNVNSKLYQAEKPRSGENNGMALSSLRGLAYDDPMWEDLLAQIDFEKDQEQISSVITYGLYMTQKLDSIGLVETIDVDGPLGLTATWSGTRGHVVACAYPCSPIIAATFSKEIARELGTSYGQEGLTNGISGWYGPAVNVHRSQFGGRNFEYFSADAVLSGKIAAQMIGGARQEGLYAHLKHFALNEMDRSRGSAMVFANEQAMREVFLKGFELGIKEATCTIKYYDGNTGTLAERELKACGAMMTSMDFVGPTFSACNYDLLTEVTRQEWGFEGFILTDFTSGTNKPKDAAYRVGNDVWMGMRKTDLQNFSNYTAQACMKNAIHNIAYTVVNSNAYNYVAPGAYAYYDMSPWKVGLITADIVVGVLDVAIIAWVVVRSFKHKED